MNKATFLLALLVAASAQAQTVSGVSGTLSHGSTITVSGSGFGTADFSGMNVLDGMENGSIATEWEDNALRQSFYSVVDTTRHANSSKAMFANLNWGVYGNPDLPAHYNDTVSSHRWFLSYWLKMGSNYTTSSSSVSNIKGFRVRGSSNENTYAGFPFSIPEYWQTWSVSIENTTQDPPQTTNTGTININDLNDGSWHHFQFSFENGSAGVADGEVIVWCDGTEVISRSNVITTDTGDAFTIQYLGLESETNCCDTDDNYVYMDDFYAATTLARVEIGDGSTYGTCTHREMQLVSSWSATSVAFTMNTGSFPEGANLYLYVTDATGAQSNAYPITLSGGGGSVTPPLNLSVSGGN